jgi:hypothetical protein
MKNIKILLVSAAVIAMMVSCAKEESPQNGVVSSAQAATSLESSVAGLHAWMNKYDVLGGGNDHRDFGYGSMILGREFMGQDFTNRLAHNQWGSWIRVLNQNPDTTITQLPWRWYYRLIFAANTIIGLVPDLQAATDPDRWSAGIAYTYRAMAYFDLARLYIEGRYMDTPEGRTVPIVTENMPAEVTGNNPRAAASELYALILSDLENAATCLADYRRPDAIMPDASVVEGMMARVYLEMGNWAEARSHAIAARTGYTPLTQAEWTDKTNGFNNPYSNNSWMWCFTTTSNDDIVQTGIICWVGHMVNENTWGYTAAGNETMIDAHLFSLIPDTDFRKKSWITPKEKTAEDWAEYSNLFTEEWNPAMEESELYPGERYMDHVSVKFRPGSGELENYVIGNSVSVPLMRMEEMMLIEAEAAGRISLAEGQALLNTFGQLRDPAYSSKATNTQEFIDEVWMQRRIELWGEGFAPFDLKRLNKPVIRGYVGTNHNPNARYNTDEMPPWLNYVIVRTEINANDGIDTQTGNNPSPTTPTPIPDDDLIEL